MQPKFVLALDQGTTSSRAILFDSTGSIVNTAQKDEYVRLEPGQRARITFLLRDVLLKPGQYFVGLWLGKHGMGAIDHIEHATSLGVMEGGENQHYVIYPGVYLCRFKQNISVQQVSTADSPDCDLRHA